MLAQGRPATFHFSQITFHLLPPSPLGSQRDLVICRVPGYAWYVSTLEEIVAAVQGLSDHDKLRLADSILASLPEAPGAMEPEGILAEAIRRDEELENGTIKPLSEEAFWEAMQRRRG